MSRSQSAAVVTSAGMPRTSASATSARICSTAASTRSRPRPLTTTEAPASASRFAIAKPISDVECVEPVTSARLPSRVSCIAEP